MSRYCLLTRVKHIKQGICVISPPLIVVKMTEGLVRVDTEVCVRERVVSNLCFKVNVELVLFVQECNCECLSACYFKRKRVGKTAWGKSEFKFAIRTNTGDFFIVYVLLNAKLRGNSCLCATVSACILE
jgi:hypothetical protein